MSEQPQRDMQAINALKLQIAQELGETARPVLSKIWFIIFLKGIDFATEILRETHTIEAAGGMFLEREQRRRTPGGVFFQLVKNRVTSRERALIFQPKQQKHKQPAKRADDPQEPRTEQHRPAVVTLSPDALPEVVQALTHVYGKASTVKLTVIGRPTQVVERGDVMIFGLLNDKAPSLPKGLPAPPAQTKYLVLVAKKQWSKVAEAIKSEDDALIIEGYPAYEPRHAGITVYALSVTTKQLEAAKRATPKHQPTS